jgi:quinoprotein glucose dehydrogenase
MMAKPTTNRRPARAVWLSALAVALCTGSGTAQRGSAKNTDWRYWGGDGATSHYSPLAQIDRSNVKRLRLVWRWKSENFGPRPDDDWKVTPLMVDGVLYFTAGSARDVVAADGVTGQTLWSFHMDEGSRGRRAPNRGPGGRGLSYWSDGRGDERLIYVSLGYELIELNPKTGRPIAAFGKDGVVDLWEGFDQTKAPKEGDFSLTSPPAVVRNVIVVGAALGGGTGGREFIAGFPRGFDVRTGKRLWMFRTIPGPGEFGNETWEKDSWAYTGHTGAWGPMSVDEELGYVYLPIETPTNDYYGGSRPGNGLFGNSLVCVDAATGRRVWHFQLTHHDIWDYDIPAAANLANITVNGKGIRALAQVTKQGFVFVFDRVTGEPVWPIVERPVPQSTAPGEKTSPTQPIPTKPAPFDLQGITLDDLNDLTPALHSEALEIAKTFSLGPVYTPGGVDKGIIISPSPNGGANWQGAALDPETGVLYVGSATEPRTLQLVRDSRRCNGADYCGDVKVLPDTYLHGLSLVKPPWGRVTAIDLNTGDRMWAIPNGPTPDAVTHNPALAGVSLQRTGTASASGLLATKTLLFSGAAGLHSSIPPRQGNPYLLAIDKKTGEVIWELKLPDDLRPSGVPMTYMIQGKQYLLVAASATMRAAGVDRAGELLVFALPGPAN